MKLFLVFFCLIFIGFSSNAQDRLDSLYKSEPSIKGTTEYLDSPFVTAGNRVYLVGHQNGGFPPLGWHIPGEMGGIWNHPIKLMDGFTARISVEKEKYELNNATQFINYPTANRLIFNDLPKGLQVERWHFVPDDKEGLLIQFIFSNNNNTILSFDFKFTGIIDLRQTWLGEETGMYNATDTLQYLSSFDGFLGKDLKNPWYVAYAGSEKPVQNTATHDSLAPQGSLTYTINIPPESSKVLNFYIAGSYRSSKEAVQTLQDIKSNSVKFILEKQERYQAIAHKTKLTIPDKQLQKTFEWLKYNSDWLVRTVPEIGTGIGAGLPDYPWWFGVDSEYALKGYMAIGQKEVVYSTIKLIDSVSTAVNGNGRIIHEMSTNGHVFNRGNINETPQFASLIWEIYKWSGDKEFLQKYFPTIKKGLEWLMEERDLNSNLFPDGFGMMEIHGLDSEMIDVASYTQKAFADASQMAAEVGEEELSQSYGNMAAELKMRINRDFWSPQHNSYADFIGSDEQALGLIEDAIIRADTLEKPWAVKELEDTKEWIRNNPSAKERPFVLHHNWVVNTPMEVKLVDSSRAVKALDQSRNYLNPFGLFVTGIDRDSLAGQDEGTFRGSKVFSYTGAVMTLPTGVLAVAENNYSRPDRALDLLKRMSRSFSYALPGSMYEVSPDYGMMVQAWNIYSFAFPVVRQFFGVDPMAGNKTIRIKPMMPTSWNEATLENIEVGDNNLDIYYYKKDGKLEILVKQEKDWNIIIELPKQFYKSLILDNEDIVHENSHRLLFDSTSREIRITGRYDTN